MQPSPMLKRTWSELGDALLKKSEFLAEIGVKDAAVEAVRKTEENSGAWEQDGFGFHNIRIGLFFTDHNIIKTKIAKAHQMLE